MLWAAVTLAFFGFLRSGEMTVPSDSAFDPAAHLTFDNVKVDNITNPTLLKIRLKASKTDPFRNGIDIVVGRTNNKLCPVLWRQSARPWAELDSTQRLIRATHSE